MKRSALLVALCALFASTAAAQPRLPTKGKGQPPIRELAPERRDARGAAADEIPPAYRPPPGMCRVWLDGVPGGQQPAPTDCAAAVRNRPANSRVIFGDDYAGAPPTAAWTRGSRAGDRAGDRSDPRLAAGDDEVADDWDDAEQDDRDTRRGATPSRRGVRSGLRGDDELAGRDGRRRAAEDDEDAYERGYRDALAGRAPGSAGYAQRFDDYLLAVPPGSDPRYFSSAAPPGRANGTCLDRDRDGWCDDPRFGPAVCRDTDGDGRCDDFPAYAAAPFASAMPDMRAAIDVQRGRGSRTALQWLGTAEVRVRATDLRRTGTPSRAMWLDANTGQLLQQWTDRDGDGIADRVEVFRNGRRVKLIGQ